MITDEQEQQVIKLIRRGKTIADVSEEMDVNYSDLSNFLDSVDRTSRLGAKRIVSYGRRDLENENDPEKRKALADRADYWVDMLYYDAKRLGEIVNQSLRTIENAKDVLDR